MGRRARRIFRGVERAVRRTVGQVVRAADTVTGDILDLDGSKQQALIEEQRRQEEAAIKAAEEAAEKARLEAAQKEAAAKAEAEEKAKKQADYEAAVSKEKDKITADQNEQLTEDTTGVGLGDVNVDWGVGGMATQGEDQLKKMLQK